MEDLDFLDLIYQQWSKTTGEENTYWIVEEVFPMWNVLAVNAEDPEDRKWIGSFDREEDADFIAGMHGCLRDLVIRLRDAIDESDRLDYRHDSQECRIAELEMETDELKRIIDSLNAQLDAAENRE